MLTVVPRADYERLKAQIEQLQKRYEATAEENRRLADQNHRLVDFARFLRDSDVKELLERLSQADQTRSAILDEMKSKLQGLQVRVNEGAGTLSLPSSSLFASGQAEPTQPGRDIILRLGSVMAEVLPCYIEAAPSSCSASRLAGADYSNLSAVYIEGHTDNTPYAATANGRLRDNWDLSAARAIAAFQIIRDNNQVVRDIRNSKGEALVGVSGYAQTRPAEPGDRNSPVAKDQDRRIEVRIVMGTNEQRVEEVLRELNQRLGDVDELIR
jgi:flagellar motor protein MotB